jgi:hypothetical protein
MLILADNDVGGAITRTSSFGIGRVGRIPRPSICASSRLQTWDWLVMRRTAPCGIGVRR